MKNLPAYMAIEQVGTTYTASCPDWVWHSQWGFRLRFGWFWWRDRVSVAQAESAVGPASALALVAAQVALVWSAEALVVVLAARVALAMETDARWIRKIGGGSGRLRHQHRRFEDGWQLRLPGVDGRPGWRLPLRRQPVHQKNVRQVRPVKRRQGRRQRPNEDPRRPVRQQATPTAAPPSEGRTAVAATTTSARSSTSKPGSSP